MINEYNYGVDFFRVFFCPGGFCSGAGSPLFLFVLFCYCYFFFLGGGLLLLMLLLMLLFCVF